MTPTTEDISSGIRSTPIAILCLIVIAALVALALLRPQTASTGMVGLAERAVLTPASVPVIEPVKLQEIAQSDAKRINGTTPFVRGTIVPAQPFRFNGGIVDLTRATDCLTTAIYYEAGAETDNGQMAVAQVILNRVRHIAFPKTVCGVVFQGSERKTGCQFSFTCDGAMARTPSALGWARANDNARKMLSGAVYAPVGNATHYHTDWVLPAWSAKLDKVRAEGTHLFFRWAGYWGTPNAFRASHAGAEPLIGKLGQIGQPGTVDGIAPLGSTDPTPVFSVSSQNNGGEAGRDTFILVVDPSVESAILVAMAEQTCGDRSYCKVFAWTDRALAPKSFPVPEANLSTIAFSYLRNTTEGFEKPLWNCAIFKRADAKQCMRHRLLGP